MDRRTVLAYPVWAWRRVRPLLFATAAAVLGGVSGCTDYASTDPVWPPATELVHQFVASPSGITMAVGADIQLTVTAFNFAGEPMTIPDTEPVTFQSLDTTRVRVTPTGLLHAVAVTGPLQFPLPPLPPDFPLPVVVLARWQHRTQSSTQIKTDSVFVRVTATAPSSPVVSMQMQLDSTWLPTTAGSSGLVAHMIPRLIAHTADGGSIPNVFVRLSGSCRIPGLQECGTTPLLGLIDGKGVVPGGRYWIYATGSVYGTMVSDSVEFTFMDPGGSTYANPFLGFGTDEFNIASRRVVLQPIEGLTNTAFVTGGAEVGVPPCLAVRFINNLVVPVDIAFADPTVTSQCIAGDSTGNIVALQPGGTTRRKFSTGGIYPWTATPTGGFPFTPAVTGTIRVRDHTMF